MSLQGRWVSKAIGGYSTSTQHPATLPLIAHISTKSPPCRLRCGSEQCMDPRGLLLVLMWEATELLSTTKTLPPPHRLKGGDKDITEPRLLRSGQEAGRPAKGSRSQWKQAGRGHPTAWTGRAMGRKQHPRMERAKPTKGQGQNPIETSREQKRSNAQTEEADIAHHTRALASSFQEAARLAQS